MVSLVITVIGNADVMSSRQCASVPCDVFHFDKGLRSRGSIRRFDVKDQQPREWDTTTLSKTPPSASLLKTAGANTLEKSIGVNRKITLLHIFIVIVDVKFRQLFRLVWIFNMLIPVSVFPLRREDLVCLLLFFPLWCSLLKKKKRAGICHV